MTERVRTNRQDRLKVAGQLRFVIYARKSGPGDRSPADQETVGRRDIDSIGGVVVAVFIDNLSASRYGKARERPGFIQMKDFIRAGRADALWTFANNRAHRRLDDYVELRNLSEETGSLWRYGGRTYDLNRSADRQATGADALRSEGQSDDISEAVNRGIQMALDENKPHGKLARGYRIIRDERTGRAIAREPIPELADQISRAADRVLDGESLRSVTRDFIPAWEAAGGPGFIDQRVLRAMLLNPTYAGIRTYLGKVHGTGTWAPILTLEQHNSLRAVLMDSERKTQRGTAPRHLLSHIALCGAPRCRERVTGKKPRRHGREYAPTYRCGDGHVSRGIDVVDRHVESLLMRLLGQPDAKAKLLAIDEDGQTSIDDEIAQIEQLRREIAQYVKDAAKTRMSAQSVALYVEAREEEIAEAQRRIDVRTARVDPLLLELAGRDVRRRWAMRTLEQQRALIRDNLTIVIMPVARSGRSGDVGVEVYPKGAILASGLSA